MKKNKTNLAGFLLFVLVASGSFITCEIGLGSSVDTKPPTVSITYPPVDSIIKNSFTMKGKASDETSLKEVSVLFVNTANASKSYGPFAATVDPAAKTWQLLANRKTASVYDIPDGSYEARITATDEAGRRSSASITYKIDNTAPILVLQSPSTLGTDSSVSAFGRDLKISGLAGDSNSVRNLVFTAYASSDGGLTFSQVGASQTVGPVPPNVDITFDDAYYQTLYPDPENPVGNKKFYYTITVADYAEEFGPETPSGSGNVSSTYYVYGKIYTDVFGGGAGGLGKKYTMTDLQNIYNGSVEDTLGVKATLAGFAVDNTAVSAGSGVFTLNPENSPTYSALTFDPLNLTTLDYPQIAKNSTIGIQVSIGRDNIPLVSDSIGVKLHYMAADNASPLDSSGNLLGGALSITLLTSVPELASDSGNLADVTAAQAQRAADLARETRAGLKDINLEYSGSNILMNLYVDQAAKKKYWLEVTGRDANKAVNNGDRLYGFYVRADGSAPVLTEIEANPDVMKYSTTGALSYSGTVVCGNGLDAFTYAITNNGATGAPVDITSSVVADAWTFVPPAIAADGEYEYKFTARDTDGNETTIKRRVYVDTHKPSITVNSVAPVVTLDLPPPTEYLNGVATVTGNILDNYRVESGTYTVKNQAGVPVIGPIALGPSLSSWSFAIDTTLLADNSNASVDISATDPAGNVESLSIPLKINQGTDRPVIAFDNMDAAGTNSGNGFGQNPVLLLTIADDDKVDVSQLEYRIDADNDGSFASVVELGTAGNKWEDEAVWNPVEIVPASDSALAQAKIQLVDFPQGAYGIQIRARDTTSAATWAAVYDNASNFGWQKSAVVPFSVDYGPPTIAITAPLAGTYKSDFSLAGSASDALGVIKVEYLINGVRTQIWADPAPADGTVFLNPPFNAVVDTDVLPTGEYILQVEATDFGGTTATQQIPITIDRTQPTVTVLQPALHAGVNGQAVVVRGEAADNRQLGAIFIWKGLVTDPDPALPSFISAGLYNAGGYTQLGSTSIWNTTIDTTAVTASPVDGYRIRVVAIDSIGNVGVPLDHLVTVNQETDRPVIGFSNLSTTDTSRLSLGNLSIIGTANDDDSVMADSFQIRVDQNGDSDFADANEGWTVISQLPASDAMVVSWNHVITDLYSEGLHQIQVRALDLNAGAANQAVFAALGPSSGLSGYTWNESAVVNFFIDNGPPALTVATPTLGQRFNVNSFTVTGTTQDTNGIKRVAIWVDDDEDTVQDAGELTILGKAMDNSGTALTVDNTAYAINTVISGLGSGAKTVRVSSYDSSDALTVRELTVVIDTVAPSALIGSPSSLSTVNGSIQIIGTATDNYQVSKVFYNVQLTAAPTPTYPTDYTELPAQTYAWNAALDTTSLVNGLHTLRVVVLDAAGNNSSASPASVNFTINQATDKPVIDVLTLDEANPATGNLLQASLAISGTVQDDDSVDRTKIQVRTRILPAGTFGPWTNVSGQPASNTSLAIWTHAFTGFTDGQYAFEIRSADTNDANSAASQSWTAANSWSSIAEVPFSVDLSLPAGSIAAPAQGSFHRNDVAISGSSSDASGIKRITIAYDSDTTGYKKQDGSAGEDVLYDDTDSSDGYASPRAWSDAYLASNGESQVFFRVTITDAFDKVRTYESNFTVDTTAPTLSFSLPSSAAVVNGSILARGSAADADRVDGVYFKANNGSGPGTWAVGTIPTDNGWISLGGTSSWEQRFKSTAYGLTDGAATIYMMAVDRAGNRSDPNLPANQRSFTITQATNDPVVTLTTASNALLDNTGTITGTVSDDDGVDASTIQISFDDGATWRAVSMPGTSGAFVNFTHQLSAGAGLAQREAPYAVRVRASDLGENFDGGDFSGVNDIAPVSALSPSLAIRKDDAAPALGIANLSNGLLTVTTLQGVYLRDRLTLTGTAADGVRVSSVEARLAGIDLDSGTAGVQDGFGTVAVSDTGTDYSTWSWSASGLSLSGTSVDLELRVTDVNGRVTATAYTLLVDTAAPSVSIETASANPDTADGKHNGGLVFRGTAADLVKVEKVYYKWGAAAAAAPAGVFATWTEAASTYSWSTASLDTVALYNDALDHSYHLSVVAVDAAGNESPVADRTFVINQGSDRPALAISAPAASQVFGSSPKAQASVADDDALASVEIRIDRNNDGDFDDAGEGYVAFASPATVSGKSVGAEHNLSALPDGYYRMQVRVRDGLYATTLSSFNETESAAVSFSIDTLPPSLALDRITVQELYVGDGDRVVASDFNGTYINNDFVLRFAASDPNGLDADTDGAGPDAATPVEVSLDNAAWTAAVHVSGNTYTASLPKASFMDGTRTVYYRATDVNGKQTNSLLTIIVDKTPPVAGFNSPTGISQNSGDEAPNVNGTSVTVTGGISDSSVISSLAMTGGISDEILFTNTSGNNTNWSFTFDATAYDDIGHAVETGSGTNVWRLPVKVTARDFAGNRSITVGYIDLDPDGDKPIVTISTPAAGASVTGIISLNGTVTDDDGSSGTVDIGLETDTDDDFNDIVYASVTVTNGAWSQAINTGGTLSGTVKFRVTPTDAHGKPGDPLQRTIFIDSSLPQITGYDGTSETAAPTPLTGTRQKGTITVRALFKDDDAIPAGNLQVSLDGGISYSAISAQPGYSITQLADAGGKKRYDVRFTVNTASYFSDNSGAGTMSVILSITDNTYKPGVVSLSYAVDNRPPEGYWDPDNGLAAPQGGIYSFFGSGSTNYNKVIGTAWDGGSISGVSSVDVFFVKGSSFRDPKSLAGSAPVTNAVLSDNLYTQLAFDAASADTGADTLTVARNWGTPNNALPVRFIGTDLPGGIDANVLYYVRDVSGDGFRLYTAPSGGSAIDISSPGSGGIMEYSVYGVPYTSDAYTDGSASGHYAIRVNKRTELGSNDANANGDGDGFQESLKDKGGYDEWFSYFDSSRLPDGPLTVYYVVSDENGNKVINRIAGQITNNPPSVTGFSINAGALTGSPLKAKAGGTITLVTNAVDTGVGPDIVDSSWKVTVLRKFAVGAGSSIGAEDTLFTSFHYGSGGVGNFSATSGGGTGTASSTLSMNTTDGADGFVDNAWYYIEAQITDADGNISANGFYLLTNNSDSTPPSVTVNPFTQASVGMWTSGQTPLRTTVTAANVTVASPGAVNVALPSWMVNGAKVMFAGTAAPGGLATGTVYYVRNKSAGSFQLSLTSSGALLPITSASGSYDLVSGGHVENAADSGHDGAGTDADLAGTVMITGTAFDATSVSSLTVEINGVSIGNATLSAGVGDPVAGYSYTWSYAWDTATQGIPAAALDNAVVRAFGTDPVGNSLAAGSRPTVTVDVAPYVTSITDSAGLSADVLRSATGKYSVAGDTASSLTVRGYNFGSSAPTVYVSPSASNPAAGVAVDTVTWTSGNEIQVRKSSSSAKLARSGYLTVRVNLVDSFNNQNDNAALDKDGNPLRNSEAGADPRSALWNDDRYLWVWGVTQLNGSAFGNQTYYYPDMVMSSAVPNQPVFSWVDDTIGAVNFNNDSDSVKYEMRQFRLQRQSSITNAGGQYFILSHMDATQNVEDNTGHLEISSSWAGTIAVGNNDGSYGATVNWPSLQGEDYPIANTANTTPSPTRKMNRFPNPKLISEGAAGAQVHNVVYNDASASFRSLNFATFTYTARTAYNLSRSAQDHARSTNVMVIPRTVGRTGSYYDMAKIGAGSVAVAYYDTVDNNLKMAYSTTAYNTATNLTTAATYAGTPEIVTLRISNATKANYTGKYFILYAATTNAAATAYDVWYDVSGSDAKPAACTNANSIRVDLSALGTPTTADICNATVDAVRQRTPFNQTAAGFSTVFSGGGTYAGNAFQLITVDPDPTDGNYVNTFAVNQGNMATATVVGYLSTAQEGQAVSTAVWNTMDIDASLNAGQQVSMVYDGASGNIFLAYYDFDDANLKVARVRWNAGAPVVEGIVFVDKYLSSGSWAKIQMLGDANLIDPSGSVSYSNPQPFVSYYSASYHGTKKPVKIAFPQFDASADGDSGTAGSQLAAHGTADSGSSDSFSGSWEVMTLPAVSAPKGGMEQFNHTMLGTYTGNALSLPVVGWLGDYLEYAKLQPNN